MNWIDPEMPAEIQNLANKVLAQFEVQGLRVRYNESLKQISFTQDRRVADIPIALIERNQWNDIRFLFHAVFDSAPSSWNLSADKNDWSAYKRN